MPLCSHVTCAQVAEYSRENAVRGVETPREEHIALNIGGSNHHKRQARTSWNAEEISDPKFSLESCLDVPYGVDGVSTGYVKREKKLEVDPT